MTKYAQGAIPHGTHNGYSNYKCRCFQCTQANTVYNAIQRERRIERGVCVECGDPAQNGVRCDKHRQLNSVNRQKCECGHRRKHHKVACSKCACVVFAKSARKKTGGRYSVLLTLEEKALALAKMRDTLKERWLIRYPEVDPDIAKKIYREGYQAGHQRARDTAKRKIFDRIAS